MQIKPLTLTIKSRDGVVYSGEVKTITSNNEKGRFDVLSYHANFIALIKDFIEYVALDGKKSNLPIRDAVMHVVDNKVDVYLGL